MSDDRSQLDQLRRQLASANTVAAFKAVYDTAELLVKRAAKAKDFPLLDDATAVLLFASRKAGALLLNGADHVVGIDADLWIHRAEMDDDTFAIVLRRAQTVRRRHAGEPAPSQRPRAEESSQAHTLVGPWRIDKQGCMTRIIAGVDAQTFKMKLAAGGDPKKIESELLRKANLKIQVQDAGPQRAPQGPSR